MSSTISSPSPTSNDKSKSKSSESLQYTCSASGCNQSFTTANDLAIHRQKHQMTLMLGPSKQALADILPFDQTPTPTKFLQYGKETGLFDEISNPFDNDFKRGTSQSLKEKARRSAIPQLVINNGMNKPRTPTNYPISQFTGYAPVAQPVHVITLTPTISSPVGALPGGQFFMPPLPSPQGFIPSLTGLSATSPLAGPALISPSIVPFSAGLPFTSMHAVVEQAALTQAFINAAAAASNQSNVAMSQGHQFATRTSSVPVQVNATTAPFPTQTVSVPVQQTQPIASSVPPIMSTQNIAAASVIQQHRQVNVDQQRRTMTQSNSLDHPNRPLSTGLERKSSFPGETSVITQAPNSSISSQMNTNMNMHSNTMGYYMGQPISGLPPFPQSIAEAPLTSSVRLSSHPVLTASRSMPTSQAPPNNSGLHNVANLPHQNSLPSMDTKQKLKETLTNNNPNLQMELSSMNFHDVDSLQNQNEVTSSSGSENAKTPGRRRGRQSEADPDRKRMRFLERNRAAASRCRAKKKQWVSGLEVKAKDLNLSNINLQNEVANLREEVASLKQLLLAHRDCPITRIQQKKLVIAGADPSVVVSNPVQAAASLLGISNDESQLTDTSLSSMIEDIKPSAGSMHGPLSHTSSTGSVDGDSQGSMLMQNSLGMNQTLVGKTEPHSNSFPTQMSQANTSTIVLNNNFSSNSSLSSTSST